MNIIPKSTHRRTHSGQGEGKIVLLCIPNSVFSVELMEGFSGNGYKSGSEKEQRCVGAGSDCARGAAAS